jgi:hypothetical protein
MWGCASSVTLTTAPVAKRVPRDLRTVRAQPQDFNGAPCLREEVVRYLDTPDGIVLARPQETYDLQLTGGLSRLEVHSNRGDKEVALLYFTAFVVTAPIAAIMYGAKDWQADAAADGELVARDRTGAMVWNKAVTVSVSENQRSMPSAEALKTAMTQAACQKLAATLLNGLAEHLGSSAAVPGTR